MPTFYERGLYLKLRFRLTLLTSFKVKFVQYFFSALQAFTFFSFHFISLAEV